MTWRWRSAELLAVLVLGLLVLVVHDVGYLLRHPFWTDESWVAVTTRFPLSQLPATTSSTPIGWSALLRVVTVGRTQTGRLLPLAFAGVSVGPGTAATTSPWLPGSAVRSGAVSPPTGRIRENTGLAALKDRVMLPNGRLIPWRSPSGTKMSIAAAAPFIPWTDLAASLAPNGSTLDYVANAPYRGRVGVLKL